MCSSDLETEVIQTLDGSHAFGIFDSGAQRRIIRGLSVFALAALVLSYAYLQMTTQIETLQ